MRLMITGREERDRRLAYLCLQKGYSLPVCGPWDAVVLPLPRSGISEERADQLPKGQTVFCGLTDAAFDRLAEKRGWRLVRVLEDEPYVLENARLTAEGTVSAAKQFLHRPLQSANALVIGYGRIGKSLVSLLRKENAHVTAAARREESRREAGKNSVSIREIPGVLPDMDLIVNTVPAPILGKNELALASPAALLLELSSPPYGIDRAAAEELGLRYRLESGIPGRYFPQAAAEALLRLIEKEAPHE